MSVSNLMGDAQLDASRFKIICERVIATSLSPPAPDLTGNKAIAYAGI